MKIQTAERSTHLDPSENTNFQRHLIAYQEACNYVSGDLLELGSGEGYGIEVLRPYVNTYTALDKYEPSFDFVGADVLFKKANFPLLSHIQDNTFDTVVSFQVIEHIKEDYLFISEIHRVLKPGGKLLFTTPNRLQSITRNPWHIREYDHRQMVHLVTSKFERYKILGTIGNDKVNANFEANKKSVSNITRWDVFNLQYKLPAFFLKIPYDILNRINKRKLHTHSLNESPITWEDFDVVDFSDQCLDFFVLCNKD